MATPRRRDDHAGPVFRGLLGRSAPSHFWADGIQRTIGLGGGDDAVHLFEQRGLFLAEADVAGRVLDQELQFGPLRGVLGKDGGGNDVAGCNSLDLTGEEGGNRAVVILVALDRDIGRRDLRQFEVFDGAAGDADRLAGKIFHLGDGKIGLVRTRRYRREHRPRRNR